MPVLPRALLAVVVLVALATGTGCGSGGDAAGYVTKVNAAQTDFARTLNGLQTDITPDSSAAADRRTLDRFQAAITKVVVALRAIDPPGSVSTLHDQLIGEISAYGAAIQDAKAKFASNDPRQILSAQKELSASVSRTAASINRTIDEINDKLH